MPGSSLHRRGPQPTVPSGWLETVPWSITLGLSNGVWELYATLCFMRPGFPCKLRRVKARSKQKYRGKRDMAMRLFACIRPS